VHARIPGASSARGRLDYSLGILPELTVSCPLSAQFKQHRNFLVGRQEYVSKKAAYNTLLNILGLSAVRGSKTLGNFSVARQDGKGNESAANKTSELKAEFLQWKIVIQSAGRIGMGGTARSGFAAKGMFDPASPPPGRLWVTTGMAPTISRSRASAPKALP
jgi:hypothetical protein